MHNPENKDYCWLCGKGVLTTIRPEPTDAEVEEARQQREKDTKSKQQYDYRMAQEPVEREKEKTYHQRLDDGFKMLDGEDVE